MPTPTDRGYAVVTTKRDGTKTVSVAADVAGRSPVGVYAEHVGATAVVVGPGVSLVEQGTMSFSAEAVEVFGDDDGVGHIATAGSTSLEASSTMSGRAAWAATCIALLAGACDGGGQADDAGPARADVRKPTACAPAAVRRYSPPSWTDLPDVPPPPMPHALDPSRRVAAFFFNHPVRAGARRGPGNKILWVVGRRPEAEPLAITARSGRRTVRSSGDAGFGSGQIQRTVMYFPTPGCWRLALQWGSNRTTLDLRVR